MTAFEGRLTAAGGTCMPITIDYVGPSWGGSERPLMDAFINRHHHDLPDIIGWERKERRRAVAICCHCGGIFVPKRKKDEWRRLSLRGEWQPPLNDPERPPTWPQWQRGAILFERPADMP